MPSENWLLPFSTASVSYYFTISEKVHKFIYGLIFMTKMQLLFPLIFFKISHLTRLYEKSLSSAGRKWIPHVSSYVMIGRWRIWCNAVTATPIIALNFIAAIFASPLISFFFRIHCGFYLAAYSKTTQGACQE